MPFTKPVGAGAGGYFAPHVRVLHPPLGRADAHRRDGRGQDRLNGAKNPLAHLHQPDITLEKVMASQMLWDPIRFDETCPSSDGACALVIGNEDIADARVAEGTPSPGSTPPRCAPNRWPTPGRDQVNPQAGRDAAEALWQGGRDHQPDRRDRRRRDLRAVLLVRADVAGEPRLRAQRARAGSSPKPARPRSAARIPVQPVRRRAVVRTRSARRA